MERHKFHIESLEKILRAIDNDIVDLKPIQNLRADVEYYIESNQESDFKENDSMYEEIDMDNLTYNHGIGSYAVPTTQSYIPSLCNGTSSSLGSNSSALMDLSGATLSLHSHSLHE